MKEYKDIRVYNKEKQELEYFAGAVLESTKFGPKYRYKDTLGEEKWIDIYKVNTKTDYITMGEPIYEMDVVLYNGVPCIVFFDEATHNAAIFYNEELLFLSNIIEDVELFATAYDSDSKLVLDARDSFNQHRYKNIIKADIYVANFKFSNGIAGVYGLTTTDGVRLSRRYAFKHNDRNFAELYCIADALTEIKLNQSAATNITLNLSNQFLVDVINNIYWINLWRKNDWKYKNGNPVDNKEKFEQIFELVNKFSRVTAVLINDERKTQLYNFCTKK